MAKLVLVRHCQSTWNDVDAWTGLTDISLSKKGREKAKKIGNFLKDIPFDLSFTIFDIEFKPQIRLLFFDFINLSNTFKYNNFLIPTNEMEPV